jgi:hypothetical protein
MRLIVAPTGRERAGDAGPDRTTPAGFAWLPALSDGLSRLPPYVSHAHALRMHAVAAASR